jgi:hypothetical protein
MRPDLPPEALIIDGIIICQDVERSLVALLKSKRPLEKAALVAVQMLADNLLDTIAELLPGDVVFRERGCH